MKTTSGFLYGETKSVEKSWFYLLSKGELISPNQEPKKVSQGKIKVGSVITLYYKYGKIGLAIDDENLGCVLEDESLISCPDLKAYVLLNLGDTIKVLPS